MVLIRAGVEIVASYIYISAVFFVDFFFFQAEDGIRDDLVTGVQTCALPISTGPRRWWRWRDGHSSRCCWISWPAPAFRTWYCARATAASRCAPAWGMAMEIGRASCRERV